MIYYLVTIALLTILFWALYKFKAISVCPICAATVITWIIGLAALYFQASWANPLLIAILMGASLGALAEKYGDSLGLFWKIGVMLIGFSAVYFLIQKSLALGLGLTALLFLSTLFFKNSKQPYKSAKDRFKNCC